MTEPDADPTPEIHRIDDFPAKYGPGGHDIPSTLGVPANAVRAVAAAASTHRRAEAAIVTDAFLKPNADDLLAALSAVPDARNQLDRDERELIDAARRLGVKWDDIADALGYIGTQARGAAHVRFTRDLGGHLHPAPGTTEPPEGASDA